MTPSPTYTSPIRGQLASEWQRHKTALIHPLLALVLLTFVLPLFSHTTLLTSVYCLFALLIGTRLAANDVLQGTEEFALSLPATRPQRYAIRAGLLMIVPLCAWIGMQLMVEGFSKKVTAMEKKLGRSGRILVRPSGTEPVIRVMVEGQDEKMIDTMADELCEMIRQTGQ